MSKRSTRSTPSGVAPPWFLSWDGFDFDATTIPVGAAAGVVIGGIVGYVLARDEWEPVTRQRSGVSMEPVEKRANELWDF